MDGHRQTDLATMSPQQQQNYGTDGSNYDIDLSLPQAQSGERCWHNSGDADAGGVAMMASIDITAHERPSPTGSCDHISRTQPNYDTRCSTCDIGRLLLQSPPGERYGNTVSRMLTAEEIALITSTLETQRARPSTNRSCGHASRRPPHYDIDGPK